MRQRTNKIPVYINGSLRHNTTGECTQDKINRLKKQLGPVQVIQHSVMFLGEETLIEESEVNAYTNLGITVYTHTIEVRRQPL